jgi:hypothetical protein
MTQERSIAKMSMSLDHEDLLAMSLHVFLSHSSADEPAVEDLARRFAKESGRAT